MSETRKSGIELLRIIAACFVVVLHYRNIAINLNTASRINILTLDLLESFAICAVNVFMAISGYFSIKSQKRTLGKALSLLFQVSIINIGLYLISITHESTSFSWSPFIQSLIPHNYFVILYLVTYFISPYMNVLINYLSQEGRRRLLYISLALFSIWPTLVNVSGKILHVEWFGLSSIGAWGSQQGFTIVNFLLLYLIGACLRLGTFSIKRNLYLIVLCGFSIFFWVLIGDTLGYSGSKTAWDYHNPFVILMAVLLLNYFKELSIQSNVINSLAKAAFFCYLIHYYILSHLKVYYFVSLPTIYMIIHLFGSIILIYLVSWLGYYLYDKLISPLFVRLDSCEVKYF